VGNLCPFSSILAIFAMGISPNFDHFWRFSPQFTHVTPRKNSERIWFVHVSFGHQIMFHLVEQNRPNLAIFDLISPIFGDFGSDFGYKLV
jgi:hypothetical protein